MNGLKGEEIPLAARILAVADRYGAMITHRGDRPESTPQDILMAFIRGFNQTMRPVTSMTRNLPVYSCKKSGSTLPALW